MDQIHEELKYPVVTSDENYDDSASRLCSHGDSGIVAPSACDAASETDYETCDSGMSSERDSVEQNISESDDRKDVIEAELTDEVDIDTVTPDIGDSGDDDMEKERPSEISRCEDSGITVSAITLNGSNTRCTKDMKVVLCHTSHNYFNIMKYRTLNYFKNLHLRS